MSRIRTERDSLGPVEVPEEALYGPQTARAVANFPVSGWRMPTGFLRALARVKRAAARVNADLGRLDPDRAGRIAAAAAEALAGTHDAHFPVDVFQTGSGTSSNMNMNEVLAARANALGGKDAAPVHPNDHVNAGQSSNDIVPTALHLALALALREELIPALGALEETLRAKAGEWEGLVTIGRTHLQDATPVTWSQIVSGWAHHVREARDALAGAIHDLSALPAGGTAVGTGLNAHPDFGARLAAALAEETGLPLREAADHVALQAGRDAVLRTSGTLRAAALAVAKIANDIRHRGSGPHCGLGELRIPAVQPGSSIMPGKVNPVLAESLMQAAAFVAGADAAVAHAAATLHTFELSAGMPLMAWEMLEAVRILAGALRSFTDGCVRSLAVDAERSRDHVERSLALVTGLVPLVGYDTAASIAKTAHAEGRPLRDVAAETTGLDRKTLDSALDPLRMTRPSE
jgi:fumarate hydratase class II